MTQLVTKLWSFCPIRHYVLGGATLYQLKVTNFGFFVVPSHATTEQLHVCVDKRVSAFVSAVLDVVGNLF